MPVCLPYFVAANATNLLRQYALPRCVVMLAIRRACGLCSWLLMVVGVGGCGWLVEVGFGVGGLMCLCGCWGWHVSLEMKRAGDLFPNHPKERTDSVRQ